MRKPRRTAEFAAEFAVALGLLTRLPVGWGSPIDARPGQAVWAYPLVGMVVGAIGAAALWAGRAAGLPGLLPALLAICAMILATGALHEDGLSDTADGFGGGANRDAKLRIMRDSRIGAYGAIALILSLAIRVSALNTVSPAAVIAVAVGSRVAMVGVLVRLPPARIDGLGAGLGPISGSSALAAALLTIAIAFALLPVRAACAVLLSNLLGSVCMIWLARRQIGGQTGDVCGAAQQVTECLALMLLARA